MADYPLFQNALKDSTPFGGTMADTSTQTPMGTQPQVAPPLPTTPQPTEMPGQAGDQVRLQKLQDDRNLLHQQMQYVATHRSTFKNPWHYAFELAISGKNETPSAAYERLGMLNKMFLVDAELAQEERLLTQPDPRTQGNLDRAAGRERRAAQMNFLDRYYRDVLKIPNPVSQENQILYMETGYGLVSGRGSEDDAVKEMQGASNLGQDVGEENVGVLGLPEPLAKVATAGAQHAARVRQETQAAKDREDTFPILGQFRKPSELYKAMMEDYRSTVAGEPYTQIKEGPEDPLSGRKQMTRIPPDKELRKQARADVASRWDGYEKYFPDFVEKGFTDVPAINPEQGDVSVEKKRAELKATAPAK